MSPKTEKVSRETKCWSPHASTTLFVLFTVVFMSVALKGLAATYYVSPDGDDEAAGTSWATALQNISTAVAKGDVSEVVLTNGTHYVTEEVLLDKAVTVRGMTTNRNLAIVNGNYPHTTNRVFYIHHAGAVVADMTITNGFVLPAPQTSSIGGGLLMRSGTVRNCLITGNTADFRGGGIWINIGVLTNSVVTGNTSGHWGGGVYVQGASRVVDSVISNNTAANSGGGIKIGLGPEVSNTDIVNNTAPRGGGVSFTTAGGVVTNCLVANNIATSSSDRGGGGIYGSAAGNVITHSRIIGNKAPNARGGGLGFTTTAGALIENSFILNNTSASAGGVSLPGSSQVIRNSLIAFNTATNMPESTWGNGSWGGIYLDNSTMVNCTIAKNTGDVETGGVRSSGEGSLVNCVIYANHVYDGDHHDWYSTGENATYSNCLSSTTENMPGSGNIAGNPWFEDAAGGNFRLRRYSPGVNAGLYQEWMDDAVDLDGGPRIRHEQVDIGAFETELLYKGTVILIR